MKISLSPQREKTVDALTELKVLSCFIALNCFNSSCFNCIANTKTLTTHFSLRLGASWGPFWKNLPLTGGQAWRALTRSRRRVSVLIPPRPATCAVATHLPRPTKLPRPEVPQRLAGSPFPLSAAGPRRRLRGPRRSTCLSSRPRSPGRELPTGLQEPGLRSLSAKVRRRRKVLEAAKWLGHRDASDLRGRSLGSKC